jgi:tetratricopeptide (TPR) repeat protein
MTIVDHSKTSVLLIGVSQYPADPTITPIPNVETNILQLAEVLNDPELVGIPKENIAVSLNESRSQILKRLNRLVNETSNKSYTILIYYSGHGFLSNDDLQLYISTPEIVADDLVDGIGIDVFKRSVKRCIAGRKIIILDCCHSGGIIDVMDDHAGLLQNNLKNFEGTYVITSASEDMSARFPSESPALPTYFTGKLLEIMRDGMDIEQEYCSLKDIYYNIKADFAQKNLPAPQQSSYNDADQIYLSKNRMYNRKSADEIAWERALKINTIWEYSLFKKKYPKSLFLKDAKQRIYLLEEEQDWKEALEFNTIFHLEGYVKKYRKGQHLQEAEKRINHIVEAEKEKQENMIWANAQENDSVRDYELYLRVYPNGRFMEEAKAGIATLETKLESSGSSNGSSNESWSGPSSDYLGEPFSVPSDEPTDESLDEPAVSPPLNNNRNLSDLFYEIKRKQFSYLFFLIIIIGVLTFFVFKTRTSPDLKNGSSPLVDTTKTDSGHLGKDYKLYLKEAEKHVTLNHFPEATANYQKAIRIDAGAYNAYFGLANVFYKRRLYDSAIINCDKAIQLQPKIADLYDKRGDCYFSKANFALAEADFNEAVKLSDDSARYYYKLGKINTKLKRKDVAMDDFNKAIYFNQQMAGAYEGRGVIYVMENYNNLALIQFNKALDLDSMLAVSYEFRGYIHKSNNRYNLALNDLSKAIALDSTKAKLYLQRAHIERITNPTGDEACLDYQTAMKLGNQEAKKYYDTYCSPAQPDF